MTTATAAATWPTEERYEEAGIALANAFNQVELIGWELDKIIRPWMDKGEVPEQLPTAETVGLMWSFIDQLRTEAEQLERSAKDLEQDLFQTDTMRREAAIRDAR